jgi:vancomycin resistance protein YoaR
MNILTIIFRFFGLLVVGFFLSSILYFLVDTDSYENRIPRKVFFGDINVSGLTQAEFELKLSEFEKTFSEKTVFLQYGSQSKEISAEDVGLNFDKDNLWKALINARKTNNIYEQFLAWLGSFREPVEIMPEQLIEVEKFAREAQVWNELVPELEPDHGSIRIDGTSVVVRYPKSGESLDITKAQELVLDALLYKESGTIITAPVAIREPNRDVETVSQLAAQIGNILSESITLYHPSYPRHSLVLEKADLAKIVYLSEPNGVDGPFQLNINHEALELLTAPLAPQEAKISIGKDEMVNIEPSRDGFDIDEVLTGRNILELDVHNLSRRVIFAFKSHVIPAFSAKDAEKLQIKEKVAQFTTYHTCCQDRVDNIQRAARIIDGTRVDPGKTFSLNKALGERTLARGFKNAGTIIDGVLEDSVGGGISQFTTTLHNAVYWGGYEVIDHKPHSIYFTRYPVGIEATINWPSVDYAFRNDSEYGILIDTSYTDTSITISLYSYNYGRKITGNHGQGLTNISVTGSQPDSRVVLSEVSEKYNIQAPKIMYRADPALARGVSVVDDEGDNQWNVNVIRKVMKGEEILRVDYWPVHYVNDPKIIRMNPCDIPGAKACSL